MAPAKRSWHLWLWLEAASLLALVAFLTQDSFVSAQCPSRNFAMCICSDLAADPRDGSARIGIDCNRQSIISVVAAIRASETVRRSVIVL